MSVPVVAALLSGPADGARAESVCEEVDRLIDHSRTQFNAIIEDKAGAFGAFDTDIVLTGASSCRVTRQPGQSWHQCGWEFPHRDQAAYDAFEAMAETMAACFGPRVPVHSDRNVNHPDFYASRRYELQHADVTVSVKDKSALGTTFVFLRIQEQRGQ